MKKKSIILSIVITFVILFLFLPIPKGVCEDGGAKVFDAVMYKIVIWNRPYAEVDDMGIPTGETPIFHKTSIYWFPNNINNIDDLWILEAPNHQ